ncbi:hypothetical protein [Spirochaeta isovalerica]|uniref:Outer membrane protein beta-barrel domain-containing protein n=1 Tax=Spirochaeta isovalerica TaxID=150 RepID=A0A841RGE2_9SPIO|nr:hypothetical protein [Spirochaeta isovalerica]MBB6482646.1 hypothetical protein [Spirochaeta isovalerica]
MKKILLIAAALLMSASLFAEKLYLMQGTYLNTSRTYESTNNIKRNYGEAGLNFTSFNGNGVGFYSSATFLLPVTFSEKENGVDTGATMNTLEILFDSWHLGLDALLGVGFLAPISPSFSLLAGAGLHFNGIALFSSYYSNYLAYNIGPGASLNAILYLTRTFNINVSGMIAWDMLEFLTLPSGSGVSAKGGLTWAVSAGMGFSY